MAARKRIDPAAVIAAYDAGQTNASALARQFGCTAPTITMHLLRAGRKPRCHADTRRIVHADVLAAFDAGERNGAALARRFGVSSQAIHILLIKNGRVPRSNAEAMKEAGAKRRAQNLARKVKALSPEARAALDRAMAAD